MVDDDHVQLKLLVSFLKKMDFEGNTAADGKEAVEKLKDGQYDIVFMDIQMPEMDGIEATRIIREELNITLPIIAVTSMDDFDYDKSIASGMNDYLKKPVALEQLKEVITKHCPDS